MKVRCPLVFHIGDCHFGYFIFHHKMWKVQFHGARHAGNRTFRTLRDEIVICGPRALKTRGRAKFARGLFYAHMFFTSNSRVTYTKFFVTCGRKCNFKKFLVVLHDENTLFITIRQEDFSTRGKNEIWNFWGRFINIVSLLNQISVLKKYIMWWIIIINSPDQ